MAGKFQHFFFAAIIIIWANFAEASGEALPAEGGASSQIETFQATTCTGLIKPVFYVVERGDQLAEIISTFGFKPLWGRRAHVNKVVGLNKIKNNDLIFPGQEIHLPFGCEEDAEKYVLIDRGADRQIKTAYLVEVKAKRQADGSHELVMPRPDGHEIPLVQDEAPVARGPGRETSAETSASVPALALPTEPSQKPVSAASSPSAAVAAPSPDDFIPYSTLSGAVLFGFSRIYSRDLSNGSTALLLSRPITGARFGWDFHWSPQISSEFNIAFRQIEMQSASDRILEKEKQSLSGMGMNFGYAWSAKYRSFLSVNFEERLFVSSTSSGIARLYTYQQPSFDLKFEGEVVRQGPLSMDVMFGARQLLGTRSPSASLQSSSEYLLGASFRQQLSKVQLELKLQYVQGQQNSNLTTQDNSAVEAQFGIKMEIGK